jgi:hypothetical protein
MIRRRDLLVRSARRGDALVASAAQRWMIHFPPAGTTSVPLRFLLSEGRGRQVRCTTFDCPFWLGKHKKRAAAIYASPQLQI